MAKRILKLTRQILEVTFALCRPVAVIVNNIAAGAAGLGFVIGLVKSDAQLPAAAATFFGAVLSRR